MSLDREALQAMMGGKMPADPADLLASLGSSEALTQRQRMLMEFFTQQASDRAEPEDAEDEALWRDEPEAVPEPRRASRPRVAQRVRRVLEALTTELETLRESHEAVAAALGSCPECVVGHADCAACHGRGRPGAFSPDPALYYALIVPAIRRMEHDTCGGNGNPATFTMFKDNHKDGGTSPDGGTHG